MKITDYVVTYNIRYLTNPRMSRFKTKRIRAISIDSLSDKNIAVAKTIQITDKLDNYFSIANRSRYKSKVQLFSGRIRCSSGLTFHFQCSFNRRQTLSNALKHAIKKQIISHNDLKWLEEFLK